MNNAISCSLFNTSGAGKFKVLLIDTNKNNYSISYFLDNKLFTCKSNLYKDNKLITTSDVKKTGPNMSSSLLNVSFTPNDILDLKLELTFAIDESKFNNIETLLKNNTKNYTLSFESTLSVEN